MGEGRETITHLGTGPLLWGDHDRNGMGNQRGVILNLFLLSLKAPASGPQASWRADLKITVWMMRMLTQETEPLDALAACLFCFTFSKLWSQRGSYDISQAPLLGVGLSLHSLRYLCGLNPSRHSPPHKRPSRALWNLTFPFPPGWSWC